jgi:hypothetical protein
MTIGGSNKDSRSQAFSWFSAVKNEKNISLIDFRINNGTDIGIAVNPLTFILFRLRRREGRVRGAKYVTQCSITFAKLNKG